MNFMFSWKYFSLKVHYCPLCGVTRPFVRLQDGEIGVRCLGCRATPITLSLVSVLKERRQDLGHLSAYELSSRGALVRFLRRHTRNLTCSEFFPDQRPGRHYHGILCQDVQCLTFAEKTFDLCTATEVFEHVANDEKGFAEIFRVLKEGGLFLFTVPLHGPKTITRAIMNTNGKLFYHLPPAYHCDPVRRGAPVLVYRDYGYDIVCILEKVGFSQAEIVMPTFSCPWSNCRPVIAAVK